MRYINLRLTYLLTYSADACRGKSANNRILISCDFPFSSYMTGEQTQTVLKYLLSDNRLTVSSRLMAVLRPLPAFEGLNLKSHSSSIAHEQRYRKITSSPVARVITTWVEVYTYNI